MLAMEHCNSSSMPLTNQTQGTASVAAVAQNVTAKSSPTMAGMSMTLGILSNMVALFILAKAYNRMRRRSKATFLLFASSLVATDLVGHLISGSMVLRRYSAAATQESDPEMAEAGFASVDPYCQFLGGCMVFFGLCPLFLGCAMAVERCLGVTKPLFHASLVSTARTKLAVSMIWLMALLVALLPSLNLGQYTYQHPRTWCFIRVLGKIQGSDLAFVAFFSLLGMGSLVVALVCNSISAITLVRGRLRKMTSNRRFSKSHDIEMVAQLLGITVTSCICWIPLLSFDLITVIQSYQGNIEDQTEYYQKLLLTGVRMASCNQILDPWVYILLRRAVLQKIYCLTTCGRVQLRGSTFRRWETSSLQSSEKKPVTRI
ncbi:prostaglandin E receptor 1b (subtype EP1) [Denticeps clupeoides]|uniref:Thromboxane A2 receptor n=1 Tax=Denticeps clupeoides TaxID=299321 RepID=A0AAY4B0I6_9TELE|nr:prostaglandin E2 receptor EP1 subtype-like [Denticeps clupeoides]